MTGSLVPSTGYRRPASSPPWSLATPSSATRVTGATKLRYIWCPPLAGSHPVPISFVPPTDRCGWTRSAATLAHLLERACFLPNREPGLRLRPPPSRGALAPGAIGVSRGTVGPTPAGAWDQAYVC